MAQESHILSYQSARFQNFCSQIELQFQVDRLVITSIFHIDPSVKATLQIQSRLNFQIKRGAEMQDSKMMCELLVKILLNRLILAIEADESSRHKHLKILQNRIKKEKSHFCFLYNKQVQTIELLLVLLKGIDIIRAKDIITIANSYLKEHYQQFMKINSLLLSSKFLTGCLLAQQRQHLHQQQIFCNCIDKRMELLKYLKKEQQGHAAQLTIYLLLKAVQQEKKVVIRKKRIRIVQKLIQQYGSSIKSLATVNTKITAMHTVETQFWKDKIAEEMHYQLPSSPLNEIQQEKSLNDCQQLYQKIRESEILDNMLSEVPRHQTLISQHLNIESKIKKILLSREPIEEPIKKPLRKRKRIAKVIPATTIKRQGSALFSKEQKRQILLMQDEDVERILKEGMLGISTDNRKNMRRVSITYEQKSKSSGKSSGHLKSGSSLPYSLGEQLQNSSLDEIKSEYMRQKKMTRISDRQQKINNTMIKISSYTSNKGNQQKSRQSGVSLIYQSLKKYQKRSKDKETIHNIMLSINDLKTEIQKIEENHRSITTIDLSREIILQKSLKSKVLTSEAMLPLFRLIQKYEQIYYRKMDLTSIANLLVMHNRLKQYKKQLKNAANRRVAEDYSFNKVIEQRLIIYRLSYVNQQKHGLLILSTQNQPPFMLELAVNSGLMKDQYLSEWPSVYFKLQKMIKNFTLYFQIFERIENDQDQLILQDNVHKALHKKQQVKLNQADISKMVQLRNLIYDTYKCMINKEIKLNGSNSIKLEQSEISQKGEILNLLYSLENYSHLISAESCLIKNRINVSLRQLQQEFKEASFLIRQSLSERDQKLIKYVQKVKGTRSIICRQLLRYQRSFILVWMQYLISDFMPQEFDSFSFVLSIMGLQMGHPQTKVIGFNLEEKSLQKMIGYQINMQKVVSYWLFQGKQLKQTQRNLILKVLDKVKMREDQDAIILRIKQHAEEEKVFYSKSYEDKLFGKVSKESRTDVQDLFKKDFQQIVDREIIFNPEASDLKTIQLSFSDADKAISSSRSIDYQDRILIKRISFKIGQMVVFGVFNGIKKICCWFQPYSMARKIISLSEQGEKGLTKLINKTSQLSRQLERSYFNDNFVRRGLQENLVMALPSTVKTHLLHCSSALRTYFEIEQKQIIVRIQNGFLCQVVSLLYSKKKTTIYEYLLEIKILGLNQKTHAHRLFLNHYDIEGFYQNQHFHQLLRNKDQVKFVLNLSKFLELRKMSFYRKVGIGMKGSSRGLQNQKKYLLVNRMQYRNSLQISKQKGFLRKQVVHSRHMISICRMIDNEFAVITLSKNIAFGAIRIDFYLPKSSINLVGYFYPQWLIQMHEGLKQYHQQLQQFIQGPDSQLNFLRNLIRAITLSDNQQYPTAIQNQYFCWLLEHSTSFKRQQRIFQILGLKVPLLRFVAQEFFQLDSESDMQVQIYLFGVPESKQSLRIQETSNIFFIIEVFSFNKRALNFQTINFRQIYNIYKAGIYFQGYYHTQKLPLRLLLELGFFIISKIKQSNFLDLTVFKNQISFISHQLEFHQRFLRTEPIYQCISFMWDINIYLYLNIGKEDVLFAAKAVRNDNEQIMLIGRSAEASLQDKQQQIISTVVNKAIQKPLKFYLQLLQN